MDAAQEKIAVARLSVYSNFALVALKIVSGALMGSVAVLSEALHSAIDLLAALIARYSVKMSAEPADREHRYGHGKYENLSGLIEGSLIFIAAAWIIYQAIDKLLRPSIQNETYYDFLLAGILIMGVSAGVNFFVSRKLMKVAKRTESLALEADAFHLTTDVLTSVGVFIALGLIQIGMPLWLDPAVAVAVAAFIIHAAYDITRRSTEGLLDKSLPETEIRLIERVIRDHEHILNYHKLRARKMGSERQIDVHMIVSRNLSVKEGHDVVDHLEHEIKKELPRSSMIIHIEPCDANCARCRMEPPDKAKKIAGIDSCSPKE
jgi:cation diffusion facilitator family transporter